MPDDETGAIYEDLVEAPESADFVQRTEDRQRLGRLFLAGLPERSRRVLEARFVRGWTLDQIGKQENLSRERVRQIERQALEWLRQEDGRGLDQTSASITDSSVEVQLQPGEGLSSHGRTQFDTASTEP